MSKDTKTPGAIVAGLGVILFVGLVAGCATAPPKAQPPVVPGYNFGYTVTGNQQATVISDASQTWVTLPPSMQLQQAEGDGKVVPFHQHGAYWLVDGIADHWILYTNRGPIAADAPDTVGVELAAARQHQYDQPVYETVHKVYSIPFLKHAAKLTEEGRKTLHTLAGDLDTAHKVETVLVTGHTTGQKPTADNTNLGAARAKAVNLWLHSHGYPSTHNLGWTAGGFGPKVVVSATYTQAKARSGVDARAGSYGRTNIAGGGRYMGGNAGTEATAGGVPRMYELRLTAGKRLSRQLQQFLSPHGWGEVWLSDDDLVVQYAGDYRAATIKGVLKRIAEDYHLQVRMYKGNHMVAVKSTEAH